MTISNNHKQTPPCSVVIRCYNEEKYIGKLLHGISQQTAFEVEIILVDSGSSDGTLAIASRYPVKIATIKPDEFSFGRSLNQGCAKATKEFIVIASAHVYPLYRDWLEKLLAPFNNPIVGLVYGRQVGGKVTKFSENQVFAKWFPEITNPDQNHPFCNNANAAIRRKLWEKYPYDENLTGLEDLDWAQRIMRAGHKIVYQAQATITHIHNEAYRQIYNRYRREAIALKCIYPNEHFHFGDFLRLFFHNVFSDYIQSFHNGFQLRNFYDIPIFRYMQFWGTYHGFRDSGSLSSQLKQTFYYPNNSRREPQSKKLHEENSLLIDYQSEGRSYRGNN